MSSQPIPSRSPIAPSPAGAANIRRSNASPPTRSTRVRAGTAVRPPLFTPPEWDLLVRLPGRVLVAATAADSADSAGTRHTVAEGIAGIEAIAAGRASPSGLVRDVVSAIFAGADDGPSGEEPGDPADAIPGVLGECRVAGRLLADRVPAEDAAAYRHWLTEIAATVCIAARTGGGPGSVRMPVSVTEQRFLAELNRSLEG